MFFYLFIIAIIIIIFFIPDGRPKSNENLGNIINKNILSQTDVLSKYILLNQYK